MAYDVLYARQFHEQLMELPDRHYDRVEKSVGILADNPGLLRDYDPPYDAAEPPVACKWYCVAATFKVLYAAVDHGSRQLRFLFMGGSREDPLHRFDRME